MKKRFLCLLLALILLLTAVQPGILMTAQAAVSAGYYLVGNMNGWTPNEAYRMALNSWADTEEYYINLSLSNTSELKVVSVDGNGSITEWFPDNCDNYSSFVPGEYTVYFRPNFDGNSDWYQDCLFAAYRYSIYIADDIQHGSVSANKSKAVATETVTLSAEPDPGYELKAFLVNGAEIEGNVFSMPENHVTVSAVFQKPGASPVFDPETDGNSFVHDNSSKTDGFWKVKNYDIPESYLLRLVNPFEYLSFKLLHTENKTWRGSCYGVAMAMALNANGTIDISSLSDTATDFHSMERPCENPGFLYTIQYYQLSQLLSEYAESEIADVYFSGKPNTIMNWCLEGIVDALKDADHAYVFSFGIPVNGKDIGHSLVAYACSLKCDPLSGERYYAVEAYDQNNSKTIEIKIAEDYSGFWFVDGTNTHFGSSDVDGETYIINKFSLIDPDEIPVPLPPCFDDKSVQSLGTDDGESPYMQLVLSSGGEYTIVSENGEALTYQDHSFGGTMETHGVTHIHYLNSPDSVVVYVDPSEVLTVSFSGESIDISAGYGDVFSSVSGTNITGAVLRPGSSVELEGENYSFEAYLSGFETDEDCGLVSVQAVCSGGTVSVSTEDGTLKLTSENTLHDLSAASYDYDPHTTEIALEDGTDVTVTDADFERERPCSGANCPGKVFTDMPAKGNWAHDAIDWALVHEITFGTSASSFSPSKGCTRGQVVTFLWRAAGCPEPTSVDCSFTDLKESAYYYKAVLWAVENGITSGTSAMTFSPNKTCTRSQIAAFLWRFAGSPEPRSTESPFSDVTETASCYKAVLWAAEQGITSGTSETTFSPAGTCTRAQVVTFLYRFMVG